jgi:hypothetical protein
MGPRQPRPLPGGLFIGGEHSMATQTPSSVTPRTKKLAVFAVVLLLIAILGVAGLVGGRLYFRFSGHNMAGLQGTWRDVHDSKHVYEFQSNGDLDCWYGSKSWFNRLGWTATWHRDGQNITIHTDRNWDLKGTLEGDTIRGKLIMKDGNSETETEADAEWRRE